ncbi:PdxT/SNO family [Chaetomium strumarium]|uniref:glutaminase n=1 Tax=Chaetomium strumarium TaxID=1170767 RepID=A0AAJ0GW76_9PEZI|nr:PdxT/SNO family [Chaetomium strumarium]
MAKHITVGVLALQGGVVEHINLLRKAATHIISSSPPNSEPQPEDPQPEDPQPEDLLQFTFPEVRTAAQLAQCDALIIPGGESTTMAIVARRLGLLDPLREFVKVRHKPVWGTCAGLVMLAEEVSSTKQGGQELVGGLDVRVRRNKFGTQLQSFVAGLELDFLEERREEEEEQAMGEEEEEKKKKVEPFKGVFIRAPVVEEVNVTAKRKGGEEMGTALPVEVLGVYQQGQGKEGSKDVVAVRQGNVFGTSFHPELTDDARIHVWWLRQVMDTLRHGSLVVNGA